MVGLPPTVTGFVSSVTELLATENNGTVVAAPAYRAALDTAVRSVTFKLTCGATTHWGQSLLLIP
jgi:hypothetical protein